MSFKKAFFSRFLTFAVGLSVIGGTNLKPAHAMDQDVRAVLVSGVYGIGAGTVLGLASFPFSGNVRGIFIGSSIGLYLGLLMGAYYVNNRYDPENPLRPMDGRPLEDPYYEYRGPPPSDDESLYTPPGFQIQIPVYAYRF